MELPTEIIQLIFLFCVGPDNVYTPSQSSPPWTLAQVCRKWRFIALDASALWHRLYISDQVAHHESDALIDVYGMWMERSSILYITLGVDPGLFDIESYPQRLAKLYKLLHAHIGKINVLRFELRESWQDDPRFLPYHALPLHFPEGATSLQHLEVAGFHDCLYAFKPTTFPNLRSFLLEGDPIRLHYMGLPWHQLTTLKLHAKSRNAHAIDFLGVLAQTPALRQFECQFAGGRDTLHCEYADGKILLEHLTELNLHGSPSGLIYFLKSLRTPSLRDLSISAGSNSTFEAFKDTLAKFMAKEARQLEYFYLQGPEYSTDQLLTLLREVSDTLQQLQVKIRPSLNDDVLSALTVSDDGTALCPHLECFTLFDWTPGSSPGLVASMIESRCLWSYPLRAVYIEVSPDVPGDDTYDDEVGLLQLYEEGLLLELEVTTGDSCVEAE
ncbi:hypothetical protein ONZ45_g3259 [Pleurotus djamor]|nr:hypothetical protein ONZ45_g3259 [Pleurotus djamor]